jgi:sarcosine oxidase gamma subunit
VDNRPTFDIYVPKSFADYLWRWMELAGQDFKIAVAE